MGNGLPRLGALAYGCNSSAGKNMIVARALHEAAAALELGKRP
jgi:hypothetical protein